MQATALSILPLAPGKYLEMPSRKICVYDARSQGLHHAKGFTIAPAGHAGHLIASSMSCEQDV